MCLHLFTELFHKDFSVIRTNCSYLIYLVYFYSSKDVVSNQIFTDLLATQDRMSTQNEDIKPYHEFLLQDGEVINQRHGLVGFLTTGEPLTMLSRDSVGWELNTLGSKSSVFVSDASQTVEPLTLGDFAFPSEPVLVELNTVEGVKNSLDDTLFSGLFGVDGNLSGPITILGLPNGIAYWMQLSKSNSAQILYCLNEPIVGIHSAKINSESSRDNCVILVGREGKLLMIMVDNKGRVVNEVTFVHSPVMASGVCDKRLVHSTGKTMCITDLEPLHEQCTEQKPREVGAQSGCSIGAFCNVFGFVITDRQGKHCMEKQM